MRKCQLGIKHLNVNTVMSVARLVILLIIEESVFNIFCFVVSKCAQSVKMKYFYSV